jgi:hypothetical protein
VFGVDPETEFIFKHNLSLKGGIIMHEITFFGSLAITFVIMANSFASATGSVSKLADIERNKRSIAGRGLKSKVTFSDKNNQPVKDNYGWVK